MLSVLTNLGYGEPALVTAVLCDAKSLGKDAVPSQSFEGCVRQRLLLRISLTDSLLE